MGKLLRIIALCAIAFFLFTYQAGATSCDEDCVGRCRRCALGVCVTEPACHLQCEAEKKTACAISTPIPHIPGPTDDPTKIPLQFCKAPFENYVHSVVAFCANWGGRDDDMGLITQAQNILVATGSVPAPAFSGVDIRWCPLGGQANGMTPVRDHVLLNPSLKGDIGWLAINLGHEMKHIEQYRRWGTDDFECRYSHELPKGTGRDNSVEDEAYSFQDQITPVIRQYVANGGGNLPPAYPAPPSQLKCGTPIGWCLMQIPGPIGGPCYCSGPPPANGTIFQ